MDLDDDDEPWVEVPPPPTLAEVPVFATPTTLYAHVVGVAIDASVAAHPRLQAASLEGAFATLGHALGWSWPGDQVVLNRLNLLGRVGGDTDLTAVERAVQLTGQLMLRQVLYFRGDEQRWWRDSSSFVLLVAVGAEPDAALLRRLHRKLRALFWVDGDGAVVVELTESTRRALEDPEPTSRRKREEQQEEEEEDVKRPRT